MKIKLDENLPTRLVEILSAVGHEVDTIVMEGLVGHEDADVWQVACQEGRFFITQDLDFSDTRMFAPGTHPGILLIRLRSPGAHAISTQIRIVAASLGEWGGCFVVLTENKVRVKRP